MNILFDLPYNLFALLCSQWLSAIELCRLDSTVPGTVCELRKQLHNCFQDKNIEFDRFIVKSRLSFNVLSYLEWRHLRHFQVQNSWYIRNAYYFLCKRIPSLLNVVGSSDSKSTRSERYIDENRSAYNYSPDSIEDIFKSMNLSPKDENIRFLDVCCDNSITGALIKSCFRCAQVACIDQKCMINTLLSIQKHCNIEFYKQLQLDSIDILSSALITYVKQFQPTYATCFSGLYHENISFLTAIQTCPKIQSIAITEHRGSNNHTQNTSTGNNINFKQYGFVLIERIAVKMACTRKKRWVLVAIRSHNDDCCDTSSSAGSNILHDDEV